MHEELYRLGEAIEELAPTLGLRCIPQEIRFVNGEQIWALLVKEWKERFSYWIRGKHYEKMERLARSFPRPLMVLYEFVAHTTPCLARIRVDTDLARQMLVLMHVYAHNDFLNNNRFFPKPLAVELHELRERNKREFIESLRRDPKIGTLKVRNFLDACTWASRHHIDIDPNSPLLLEFFANQNPRLEDWERSVALMIAAEWRESIPSMKTQVMNEGWACDQEERMLELLPIPRELRRGAGIFHRGLVATAREPTADITPYQLGYAIWQDIGRRLGEAAKPPIRTSLHDEQFVRQYFTEDVATELNLAIFEHEGEGRARKLNRVVRAASYPGAFQFIQRRVMQNLAVNQIPRVSIAEIRNDVLYLTHYYDGRALTHDETANWLGRVAEFLWKAPAKLMTQTEKEYMVYSANQHGRVANPEKKAL